MATSTVIPGDITTLKGDVSKTKEDISSINGKVSTLQIDMTSAKQDISTRYTKTEVDNKLKNKVEANDLESGRYGGDFYPLTGREAFIYGIWPRQQRRQTFILILTPQFRLYCGQHRLFAINIQ